MIKNQTPLPSLTRRLPHPLLISLLSILALGLVQVANAQTTEKPAPSDPLSGQYEGTVKTSGVDTRLTLELTNDKGKVTGRLVTPKETTPIQEGTFIDGKLVLKTGKGETAATLNAVLQGDKLSGEWIEGQQKRSVALNRVAAVASASPASTEATPAPVSLAGEWEGLADAQGQGFPFLLTLKLEGEKVTGESSSSLGVGTISNGTFKDGKLVFQIDTPSGVIMMNAVVKDGGLTGDFDYAGQAQGRWVAKRKTP